MSLLEKPLKMVANHFIKNYGHIEDLQLDTAKSSARARVMLEGETLPIDIAIGRYAFFKRDGRVLIQLGEISCSRPWMHKLISQLHPEPVLEVPESVARLLVFARMV